MYANKISASDRSANNKVFSKNLSFLKRWMSLKMKRPVMDFFFSRNLQNKIQ